MVAHVKARFGYDDSLDAFGVHGAGGTIGALLTGVFALRVINPVFKDGAGNILPSGALEGKLKQLSYQMVGVLIAWTLAAAGTFLILKRVDAGIGVRVSEEQEIRGLDLTQHVEEAYYDEAPAYSTASGD